MAFITVAVKVTGTPNWDVPSDDASAVVVEATVVVEAAVFTA